MPGLGRHRQPPQLSPARFGKEVEHRPLRPAPVVRGLVGLEFHHLGIQDDDTDFLRYFPDLRVRLSVLLSTTVLDRQSRSTYHTDELAHHIAQPPRTFGLGRVVLVCR